MDSASSLDNLLIDTWWYGLSARLDDARFEALAQQRVREGFNAVQLVAGIPPEVAPGHAQAQSPVGLPWNMQAQINQEYLEFARQRIQRLNELGLRVIVLGGWGMQIEWIGAAFMERWWQVLIEHLDDLDVIYCVTGEVDLWIDMPNLLMPNRSTDDLRGGAERNWRWLRRKVEKLAKKCLRAKTRLLQPYAEAHRKKTWGRVLKTIKQQGSHPVIVHTGGMPGAHSHNMIAHSELLDAVTVQTGHDRSSTSLLWHLPVRLINEYQQRFINLEPWYEGIRDDFFTEDQLFAYWCNMLAGACSFAYGAHGVWNVGDGKFLAHWGAQTLEQAMQIETGSLLGKSHAYFLSHAGYDRDAVTKVVERDGKLESISRKFASGMMTFVPEVEAAVEVGAGEMFDPLSGEMLEQMPQKGPLLIWSPT